MSEYSHDHIRQMLDSGDTDLAWMAPEIIYQLLNEITTLKEQCPFCEGRGVVSIVSTVRTVPDEECGFCHGSGKRMGLEKPDGSDQPAQ